MKKTEFYGWATRRERGDRGASGIAKAILLAAFFAGIAGNDARADATFGEPDAEPGQVIVKFRPAADRTRVKMSYLYKLLGAQHVRRFPGHGDSAGALEQLQLAAGASVDDAVRLLQQSPLVEYAQPNYRVHSMPISIPEASAPGPSHCWFPGVDYPAGCAQDGGDQGSAGIGDITRPSLAAAPLEVNPPVSDPQLASAYGLAKIGAPDAWMVNPGNKAMVVAVIDTGVDYNHEDLAFNIWRNPNPSTRNDVVGYDFVHDDGLPFDDNEHGTHTSGTVGAVGGNGIGISGVAQRVSLMAVKFLDRRGSGTSADAVRAIDYAVAHGARILSNSWGGPADRENKVLYDAVDRARAQGVLLVAAAGNDGRSNDGSHPDYPSSFASDNVVAVAATDANDELASFSNYGAKSVHLAAPGKDVYSTIPGNKYAKLSGTSMACPHVAGAAAVVWSRHPEWTYLQVKAALLTSVDRLPALQGKVASGGRLNLARALQYAPPTVTPPAPPSTFGRR